MNPLTQTLNQVKMNEKELAAGVARLLTRARGTMVEAPDTVIRHRWTRDPHTQVSKENICCFAKNIYCCSSYLILSFYSAGIATPVWARQWVTGLRCWPRCPAPRCPASCWLASTPAAATPPQCTGRGTPASPRPRPSCSGAGARQLALGGNCYLI